MTSLEMKANRRLGRTEKAMSFFLNPERKTIKYCCLALFLLLFGQSSKAEAQSGRRVGKPQPESSPVPQPIASPDPSTSNAAAAPPPGSLKQTVRLMIGRHSTQRHLQSEDVIFASFVKRLNSFPNVATTAIGELKRQEAVIQAKNISDSFVVLLSFEIDSFQNGTIILNSPDLQTSIRYLRHAQARNLQRGKSTFSQLAAVECVGVNGREAPRSELPPKLRGRKPPNLFMIGYDWTRRAIRSGNSKCPTHFSLSCGGRGASEP